jgi:hypothetical protein
MTTPQNPSRFSADDSALLLIDHQVGTMQLIKNIDRELAAKQSIALAKMAKILDMPVVITSSQEDHAQGPILPEIAGILPYCNYLARITPAVCVSPSRSGARCRRGMDRGSTSLLIHRLPCGFVSALSCAARQLARIECPKARSSSNS